MLINGNLALQNNSYEEEVVVNEASMDELKLAYEKQMELLFDIAENTKDTNVRVLVDKQMTSLNNIYMELTGETIELENDLGENLNAYEEFMDEQSDEYWEAYEKAYEE